jgi:hypothetical protein
VKASSIAYQTYVKMIIILPDRIDRPAKLMAMEAASAPTTKLATSRPRPV